MNINSFGATFTEKIHASWRGEFSQRFSLFLGKYYIFKQRENTGSAIAWRFLAQTRPQAGILPSSPQEAPGIGWRGVKERTLISGWGVEGQGKRSGEVTSEILDTGRESSGCL